MLGSGTSGGSSVFPTAPGLALLFAVAPPPAPADLAGVGFFSATGFFRGGASAGLSPPPSPLPSPPPAATFFLGAYQKKLST